MALFPRIQSPCPYQDNLAAIMDGDMCRMCKRQVFDLTAMDDAGRVAFFANCGTEEVCVSYKLPLRLAALAMAASVATLPAAAATGPDVPAPDEAAYEEIIVTAGGIRAPQAVEFVQVSEETADAKIPELPVIVEPTAAQPKPGAGTQSGPLPGQR